MAGDKKVGKFLTTAKVPRATRNDILVFDDGVRIVWVCPVRISESVKVTSATRRLLHLKVIPLPRTELEESSNHVGDCNHEHCRSDAS
jgi:hypothetical protein